MDVEIEKPHVHHHPTGHRWLDLVVPLAALFVSFLSILIAWHHGEVMKQLVHQNERLVQANSLPHLQLFGGNVTATGEPEVSFSAANQGVGPADIRTVEISVDGHAVANLSALLRASCATRNFSGVTSSTLLGAMIRPGQTVEYLRVPAAKNALLAEQLDAARKSDRIKARVCYCSVFDDCWVRSSDDNARPLAVDSCPIPPVQYRE